MNKCRKYAGGIFHLFKSLRDRLIEDMENWNPVLHFIIRTSMASLVYDDIFDVQVMKWNLYSRTEVVVDATEVGRTDESNMFRVRKCCEMC